MIEKINFGEIKYRLGMLMGEALVNQIDTDGHKKVFNRYLQTIKSSPILTMEYYVYSNLENKTLKDENAAVRYIDEHLKMIKKHQLSDIIFEHKKLIPFKGTSAIPENKKVLYQAIQCLIEESLKENNVVGIDKLHESFETVLDHIRKEKPTTSQVVKENEERQKVMSYFSPAFIRKQLIERFTKKYDSLSDEDHQLLICMVSKDNTKKQQVYESLINDNRSLLESKKTEAEGDASRKLERAIKRLDEMKYNEENFLDDIFKLIDLKTSLL